jgi:predicted DNA-binding transcriptional regulator AlpA
MEINMNNRQDLLKPIEVSKILGVSVETLNVWRATNRYQLPYVKAGRLVRYRLSDVNSFIESRVHGLSA